MRHGGPNTLLGLAADWTWDIGRRSARNGSKPDEKSSKTRVLRSPEQEHSERRERGGHPSHSKTEPHHL